MGSNNYTMIEVMSFDGHYMPPEFAPVKERIRNFQVWDEDIFVTSYPKSGTTWCQELVWLVVNDLDYEKAKIELNVRFPWLELSGCAKSISKYIQNNNFENNLPKVLSHLGDTIDALERMKTRRFIKSHLPWHLLPKEIQEEQKSPKIVHIMRDPKQVVVSYFHYATRVMQIYQGSMDDCIDLYISGKLPFGDYFNTVTSYWKKRHLPNVLVITYEQMHADIESVIRKVSAFFGKPYSDEEIKRLRHHLSFDNMKENSSVNKKFAYKNKNFSFMRKGITDDYKTELTPEHIKKLDTWIRKNTIDTELPYAI